MTTTKTGEQTSKGGMTLDEIAKWVEDARRLEIPGDTRPKVTVTWGGRVKKIEVKG